LLRIKSFGKVVRGKYLRHFREILHFVY
jgi:hypothetical protein